MARLVLGVFAALIVGFAVWAALPTSRPLAAPITTAARTPASAAPPSPSPSPSPSPTPLAPPADLDAKVAGCVGAQRTVAAARAQRNGPTPAGQPTDAAVVARGCAPLYQQPACRDAMIHFDDPPPEKRSIAVLQACARVYCPILAAPKPAVCARPDAVPEDEQQFVAWNELRTAILTHDIGASATQLVLSPPDRGR
jgi:hypothetical protein